MKKTNEMIHFNNCKNTFRLGNLCYKDTHDEKSPICIVKLEEYKDVVSANMNSDYSHIDIAEAKCLGFFSFWEEIEEEHSTRYAFKDKDCTITLVNHYDRYSINIDTPIGKLQKFVVNLHEVQNLYFFMTGKELNITQRYNHISEVPVLSDYFSGMVEYMEEKQNERI